MATLNIKNLPEALYRKLKKRAERQRRSIAQEVTQILEDTLAERGSSSILELRGLGREQWVATDATAHVAAERSTWD
jgi:plasmid stability protein